MVFSSIFFVLSHHSCSSLTHSTQIGSPLVLLGAGHDEGNRFIGIVLRAKNDCDVIELFVFTSAIVSSESVRSRISVELVEPRPWAIN